MATYQNQKGFWVKRAMDINPQWISVREGTDEAIEKAKKEWASRNTYTGDMAVNNVQWVGEDPATMYTDVVTNNTKKYTGATVDPLEEDYLDNLMRQVEEQYGAQKSYAKEDYNTLVSQLKEGRDLWQKDMEKTYGQSLEKANVNVYDRGVQDSGIKGRQTTDMTENKVYQEDQQNLIEKQKKQIANQSLRQNLENINRSEERAKFGIKNTYAGYTYI